VLNSVLSNPRWGWDVFAEWFFAEPVLAGLGRTLLLTLLGADLGFLLGTVLALARVSARRCWRGSVLGLCLAVPLDPADRAAADPEQSRLSLRDGLTLGIPFTDITFFSYPTTQLHHAPSWRRCSG
jgi:polar amino acid transport system permease protein